MTRKTEYHIDHVLAKIIVWLISGICILAYMGEFNWLVMICHSLYFFGVNTVQYIIEELYHHKHKVHKI